MQDLIWLEPLTPFEIMDKAIKDYEIDSIFVLYSGGKDSSCVADFIAKNYPKQFKKGGLVFTCTGIGAPITRKFAIEYCNKKEWALNFTWPSEFERYYCVVMKYGFAGAGNHQMFMGYLKYHTWYYFMKQQLQNGKKACFISGVRKKESMARDKRKFYSKTPVDVDGKLIFIKPFLYKKWYTIN